MMDYSERRREPASRLPKVVIDVVAFHKQSMEALRLAGGMN